ncbi:MAG: glycosyltransferase, partial [Gammaproteobacteria bacterium]
MFRSFAVYWRQALSVARSRGLRTLPRLIARRIRRLAGRYHHGFYDFEYAKWKKNRPLLSNPEESVFGPRFSIIVPVYDVEKKWLIETIESVRAQHYQDWQLCLINDGSTKTHIKQTLDHYSASDARIIAHHHSENLGIAQSSNTGLSMADGGYIILLDHDDLLEPDALSVLALTIAKHPDADLIYSDEDKVDSDGNYSHPFFKPEFSPTLLLCQNYVGHLVGCSRELLQDIGGFRTGFDGAQDYDLVLRGSRAAKRIVHIPQV